VTETATDALAARRRTRLLQRYGKRRRTVVGYTGSGDTLWVVAEQGRHASYVANLVRQPKVRVHDPLRPRL